MENLKIPKAGEGETIHREPVKSNRFADFNTILVFAGQLKKTAEAKRLASKAHTKLRKQFKDTGVTNNVFDTFSRLADQDDANAVEKFIEEFMHIAKAFSHPIATGTQFSFFDGPGNVMDAKEKAYQTGFIRGAMGDDPDTQAYRENTDLGQEHLRGYYDGQKVLSDKFLHINDVARQEEAAKKEKQEEAAKRKAEREAKAAEKAGRTVPKTEDGETVQ
jgi:hypothetical protein